MELLDSYLKTVARFLPAAERDDIVRELSENLRSQVEDREAELDRPLSEAELKALLDAFGTPIEVAGRYRQGSGVLAFGPILVGPVLFPFYSKVLGFLLGVTACAIVIIGVALRTPAGNLVQALLTQLAIQFGIVTLIFSVAQASLARRPRLFDMSYALSYITPTEALDTPRVPRLESLSQIVARGILLAWLPAMRDFARQAIAEAGLTSAPVWGQIYVALACLWAAAIVRAAVVLVRPDLTRFWSASRSALDVAWLGMLVVILGAGRWVAPLASNTASSLADRVAEAINRWGFISLLIIAVASAVNLFLGLRRAISGKGVVH